MHGRYRDRSTGHFALSPGQHRPRGRSGWPEIELGSGAGAVHKLRRRKQIAGSATACGIRAAEHLKSVGEIPEIDGDTILGSTIGFYVLTETPRSFVEG